MQLYKKYYLAIKMRNDVSTKEMYTQTALVNICIGEAVK